MKKIIKAFFKTLLLLVKYTLLAILLVLIGKYVSWMMYVLLIIGTVLVFIGYFKDEEE